MNEAQAVTAAIEQTAANQRREELEAALWQQHTAPGQMEYLLSLADRYAAAKADDEIEHREGRQRLEIASAEYWGSRCG